MIAKNCLFRHHRGEIGKPYRKDAEVAEQRLVLLLGKQEISAFFALPQWAVMMVAS